MKASEMNPTITDIGSLLRRPQVTLPHNNCVCSVWRIPHCEGTLITHPLSERILWRLMQSEVS